MPISAASGTCTSTPVPPPPLDGVQTVQAAPQSSSGGTITTAVPKHSEPEAEKECVRIVIPPVSVTEDSGFITHLVDLINTGYTGAEAGLFSPQYRRTNTKELPEIIHKGELGIAYRISPSRDGNTQLIPPRSVVGCVRILQLSDTTGGFGMLVCDPTFRGTGTGRDLVKFAEERCKELGKTIMQCELLVSTEFLHPFKVRMQSWYERMGYVVIRHGDFNEDYPHLGPHLITRCDYKVFTKALA
jgi:GNAT superfamily N-acetyltransferase